mmetsp:Transcript_30358/g.46462  ORF Transcript_30358/g.46462 Transcript_30358/m.46462 type:complete len:111 (-) Transcript_30358:869-1201(-)
MVSNLFTNDDLEEILVDLSKQLQKLGTNAAGGLKLFFSRCIKNVHIFISMSPVGDDLREVSYMYPALINCMTIDWLNPWPFEALKAVATTDLIEVLNKLRSSNESAESDS